MKYGQYSSELHDGTIYTARWFAPETDPELMCRCGCRKFAIIGDMLMFLDELRDAAECPIWTTSGTRCRAHQEHLLQNNPNAVGNTPHEIQTDGLSYAIDSLVPEKFRNYSKQPEELYRDFIRKHHPTVRIGWRKYMLYRLKLLDSPTHRTFAPQPFVHIDMAYLLEGRHMNPIKAAAWRPGVEW